MSFGEGQIRGESQMRSESLEVLLLARSESEVGFTERGIVYERRERSLKLQGAADC